jgi:hypothetical protein
VHDVGVQPLHDPAQPPGLRGRAGPDGAAS